MRLIEVYFKKSHRKKDLLNLCSASIHLIVRKTETLNRSSCYLIDLGINYWTPADLLKLSNNLALFWILSFNNSLDAL